jgi:hypothetical protein
MCTLYITAHPTHIHSLHVGTCEICNYVYIYISNTYKQVPNCKCVSIKKKTECVVKTHDRSETFVLQGNIVINLLFINHF